MTFRLTDQSRSRCFQRPFVVSLMRKLNFSYIRLFYEARTRLFSTISVVTKAPGEVLPFDFKQQLEKVVGRRDFSRNLLFPNLENDMGENGKH